ncbi:hypothetical protein [Tepidiforma sp.]|uniref:hypothetical protein n=1 Tax=Tepidiforma sp. TaxID=2682230 RepID=UPI002626EDBF|nr:hypothetical protein [Tepidiforma sp.]MCX7619101.1 hypothetical protein [Tepidiforma sp.]
MARCADCGLLGLRGAADGALLEAREDYRRSYWCSYGIPDEPVCAANRADLAAEVVLAWRRRTGYEGPINRVYLFVSGDRGVDCSAPEQEDVRAVLTRRRRCRAALTYLPGLPPAERLRFGHAVRSDRLARLLSVVALILSACSIALGLLRP